MTPRWGPAARKKGEEKIKTYDIGFIPLRERLYLGVIDRVDKKEESGYVLSVPAKNGIRFESRIEEATAWRGPKC